VPFAVPLEDAHLDDIQHLTGIAVPREQIAASPPELVRALLRAWAELDDARVRMAVRTSVEQRLTHTPTIVVMDQISRLADYSQLLLEPEARMLPRYYGEILWRQWGAAESALDGWPDGQLVRSNFRNVVRQLHDAGVTTRGGGRQRALLFQGDAGRGDRALPRQVQRLAVRSPHPTDRAGVGAAMTRASLAAPPTCALARL
jgi:hypothetical protein